MAERTDFKGPVLDEHESDALADETEEIFRLNDELRRAHRRLEELGALDNEQCFRATVGEARRLYDRGRWLLLEADSNLSHSDAMEATALAAAYFAASQAAAACAPIEHGEVYEKGSRL